jgi:LacI family transcriptional regulator
VKYFDIKDSITKLIKDRGLKPGMRIPPFRTLANELNTCVPTIQRAIRQLVKEGVLYSKVGSGTYISQASYRKKGNQMVGILLPYSMGIMADFVSENLDAIRSTLMENEFIPITVSPQPGLGGHKRGEAEITLIQQLLQYGVAGIIIDSLAPATDNFWLYLEKLDIPVVLFNNIGTNYSRFDNVTSDNYSGGILAGKRFIEAGKQHCCFYTSDDHSTVEKERYEGFCQAFAAANLPLPTRVTPPNKDSIFTDKYDGVFTMSDTMAGWVYDKCRELDLKIPNDIAVIGFDNSLLCNKLEPNLDSIEQQVRLMGSHAAELMIKKLTYPELRERVTFRLDVALIKRNSVM